MPVYTYTAMNGRGKTTKGIINADSARAARVKLRQSSLFPMELIETAKADATAYGRRDISLFSRVRVQDVTIMKWEFGTLVSVSAIIACCARPWGASFR